MAESNLLKRFGEIDRVLVVCCRVVTPTVNEKNYDDVGGLRRLRDCLERPRRYFGIPE